MVSAVFHSPRAGQSPATTATPGATAAAPARAASPTRSQPPRSRSARRFDVSEWLQQGLPPLFGLLLLVGLWHLAATSGEGQFPTPGATWSAALVLFADPFFVNGPNDVGIGLSLIHI